MSKATDRLFKAFELLNVALDEVEAAQHGITDDEYTRDLPSVVVASYEPLQEKSRFVLLGTVDHAADSFEAGMAEPGNAPFRQAFAQAIYRRTNSQS
jgi:hypothetical protein